MLIHTALSKIKPKQLSAIKPKNSFSLLAKTAPLVGLTSGIATTYGVYLDGTEKGKTAAKEELASSYLDLFMSSQSSSRYSNLLEKVKNFTRISMFDNAVFPFYVKTKNIIGSLIKETIGSVIPLGLSLGAVALPMMAKKGNINPSMGKWGSIACASALVLEGAKTFVTDVLGIGE